MGSLARFLGVVGLGAIAYLFGSWLAKPTAATAAALLVVAVVGVLVGTATFRTRRRSFLGPSLPGPGSEFPGVGGVLSRLRPPPRDRAETPETSVTSTALSPRAEAGPEVATSSANSPAAEADTSEDAQARAVPEAAEASEWKPSGAKGPAEAEEPAEGPAELAEEPAEAEEAADAAEPVEAAPAEPAEAAEPVEASRADLAAAEESAEAGAEEPAEAEGPAEHAEAELKGGDADSSSAPSPEEVSQPSGDGPAKAPPMRPVFGRGKTARRLRRRLGNLSSSR